MKKIKGVLWDNDGVLVDTERLFYEANRQLLREHAVDLTEKQYFDWFLDENYGAWHLLRAKGYGDERIQLLRIERRRRFSALLRQAQHVAIRDMEQLLSHFWRRIPMAVVTSAHGEHFRQSHATCALQGYFDFVLTREMYANSKPAPDGYLMGLQRFGLHPDECIAVEDSPRGLRAANAAGLECIVVRNSMNRHYAFDHAFCVVDSVAELHEVIDSFVN
ncbi:HAD family hydrolase [Janthinobacterium agaricidamnosum]|uniref:phosphoglycolate phosphatase n=1 Tax=Janthinobacterium agaricidamnosum NBRC 102515 = DSM 9628 TaxID=1349767 RepID=W0V654_9BURK|nr:HAD family phosphatase [Janthinobacterium agaricidamnosum]CDG82833.1 HAD-superhydrolase, subIA, variant 3 family protein [Janthinobacterium agaricidamnosum NBRC 102515 = DSM 9628]